MRKQPSSTKVYPTAPTRAEATLAEADLPRKSSLAPPLGNRWVRRAVLGNAGESGLQATLRGLATRLLASTWFATFITLVVLINTITLGLVDYSDPWADGPNPTLLRNRLVDQMNNISLGIFLAEAVLKVLSMGFVYGPTAYCKDYWNLLDLVVLLSGFITASCLGWFFHAGSVGQLRVLRVLRPLRTLHSFPGLKVLVNGVLSSLPALFDVGILLGFSYLVFAILGMEIWSGTYHQRCRLTEFPVLLNFEAANAPSAAAYPNQTYLDLILANPSAYRCPRTDVENDNWTEPLNCFWPLNTNDTQYCGSRPCAPGTFCGSNFDASGRPRFRNVLLNGSMLVDMATEGDFLPNLNFGLTSFDTVGHTLVIIAQIVTASGWMVLTQNTQDAYSWLAAGVYYNTVLFLGMCFLLQLNMAVMFNEYEKAKTALDKATSRPLGLIRRRLQRQYYRRVKTLPLSTLRRHVRHVVTSVRFHRLGLGMTLLNVALLASDHHPQTASFRANVEIGNLGFLLYFTVEMALKIYGLGFTVYRQDRFNLYDMVTILMGGVETLLHPPAFLDGTPGARSPFAILRAARAIKLAYSWPSFQRLLTAIVGALQEILNFLFFLVLFIYMYALMGMELFATKYKFDALNRPQLFNATDPSVVLHRSNFDTIQWAFFTVFQVITYDNWPMVMYDGWLSAGLVAPFYFVSIVILGVWVVMNMFSAIMVQSVMEDASAKPAIVGDVDANLRTRLRLRQLRRILRRLMGVHSVLSAPTMDTDDSSLGRKSFGCFGLSSPLRQACLALVRHPRWHVFVTMSIVVSCIVTALDTPLLNPHDGLGYAMTIINNALAIVFTFEMLLTMLALGFTAYLTDPWRVLDLFIVGVCLLSWSATGVFAQLRALRSLRALRPLRVIHRLPQLQVVVNTLFRCLPDIGRSLLFFVFMLLLFGIACVKFFKGSMSTCSVSPYNYLDTPLYTPPPPWFPASYSGAYSMADLERLDVMSFPRPWNNLTAASQMALAPYWNRTCHFNARLPTSKDVCECFNMTWQPVVPQRFDNIALALGSLYELTTMEGWSFVAIAAVDATGPDSQPLRNHQEGWMVFWFLFMIVGAFFVTNLFIGVLCDSFMRENYGVMVTDEQLDWIKLQRKVLTMAPVVRYPPPSESTWRHACYKLVERPAFETSVMAAILINLFVMSTGSFGQPSWVRTTSTVATNLLSAAFALEAALKIAAFGPRYFASSAHRFDLAVVLLALLGMGLPDSAGMGTIATVVRVFRVGRVLRLFQKATLLKSLFDTITVSLPAMGNVTALLMLLYYIFAAVGVQLFAKVAYGPSMVNPHQNFQNFWLALQTLIGFSTGENWNNYLWELYHIAPTSNPECMEPAFNASVCGFGDAIDCVPLDGCGSWYIVPFMYLFELVVGYIGLNLFSGIVVDAIGDSCAKSALSPSNLAEFTAMWAEYDPNGSGFVTIDDLCRLLSRLNAPFGFKLVAHMTTRKIYHAIGGLDIPIYDGRLVHFKDVPRALVQRSLSEGDQSKFYEIGALMARLGIAKQFDDVWQRSHSKAMVRDLRARAVTPIRDFVAFLIVAKFLRCVRYRLERRRRLYRRLLHMELQSRRERIEAKLHPHHLPPLERVPPALL